MKMKQKFLRFSHLVIATGISLSVFSQSYTYPFQNSALSFQERAKDVVSRLTLEEKVAQMLNSAPAIPRLNIPAHDWWNEVLHGVARTPYRVTVFPQAIAMAGTFDTNALYKMADYSALEGRAVYNRAVAEGKEGQKYLGLTYWTPNINIFRDPRWGRGQETYGEDPYLTARLGMSFVRGLQGNDPKYLKAAACAKHYAVHSGPEPLRHVFNAEATPYDLWDTYLPAFEKLVVDANVAGVMCAYNAFRKQPCCGSDILMNDILRKQWNFTGYVTSDCNGINDFYKNHKTHANAEEASADAVMHGTDVDCGREAYLGLVNAVKNGKLPESKIDESLQRLFLVRFKLGLFDPKELSPYGNIPVSVLESKAHKEHALKMAQQSMVLLKNANQTLPLSKQLKKIVVLGPNANNDISILGNYNGVPSQLTNALKGIQSKVGAHTNVVFEKAVNFTNNDILKFRNTTEQFSYNGKKGVYVEFFNNKELKGNASHSMYVSSINKIWQEGEAVADNIAATDFSARYVTDFKATATEKLNLEVEADNGYRLFINGKIAVDEWQNKRKEIKRYVLEAEKDVVYNITMEYWQGDGPAMVRLDIGHYEKTDFDALVKRHSDADAFIFVGGISPQLEGEEMRVSERGFNGGDKTSILLPAIQTALMKTLKASGKPVVFVMMTGSAVATPWESENIPAILNAWYGGQASGEAIADILFGDYNPSGRLPVTFYRSDADLPDFVDYSMTNRTYRYFTGKPLYGFGYGLSYSTFRYAGLTIPKTVAKGKNISVSVQITNTGKQAGDEVAQLYLRNQNPGIKTAIKVLKGFQRVHLKAGETKTIHFTLTPDELSYIAQDGKKTLLTGNVNIAIGGHQPDEPNKTSGNVVQSVVAIK
mgnify:FL=1